jgi:hypothetical protein
MLETNSRAIYLDELKPPSGYKFDRAIGTTFTLDLLAMLMVPLSLSLYELDDKEKLLRDPILVLEALKQNREKFAVFCHEGYIALPRSESLLYSFLEPSVIQVTPPTEGGIFHPKIWVIRFIRETDVLYRFISLTRNLTFDRSWDVSLKLEGALEDRQLGFSRNKPLADFIQSLSEMSAVGIKPTIKEHIDIISSEIRKVNFEIPWGFEDLSSFNPSGIKGYKKQPSVESYDRSLVISPFITDKMVLSLCNNGKNNILISRVESLDDLKQDTYDKLVDSNTEIFVMHDGTEDPDEILEDNNSDKTITKIPDEFSNTELRGLHAKVIVVETGWNASIICGSANFTDPGFNGNNVEFMTHLEGKKSKIGINQIMNQDDNSSSFYNLIVKYNRSDKIVNDEVGKSLENQLNKARNELIKSGYTIIIKDNSDSSYSMNLKASKHVNTELSDIHISCFPITLSSDFSVPVGLSIDADIIFKSVSIQSLTSLIAFVITAQKNDIKKHDAFVINLPVEGMPENRDRNIMMSIIKDKGRFLRYLLLILSEDCNEFLINELLAASNTNQKHDNIASQQAISGMDIPLLEELVRAFSRDKDKINRISKLIDELKSEVGWEKLIPEHFERTWNAFIEAMPQKEQ